MQHFRLKILFFFFSIFVIIRGNLYARAITDMAGRKVNIPDKITRIVPYDNKTNVVLFPVAGDLMVCKARSMESPYLKLISKDFLNKKEIDCKNAEEVIKIKPDLLIVAAFLSDRDNLSNYEAFAARINIPLVIVDLELMNLDKSFDFLGQILGKQVEAKACADYIRNVYKDVETYKKGKRVPGKAYMANDNNGLRTSPNTSNHAQLFDVMKITNAAQVGLDPKGFAQVSMEQIMVWNPDYVFCVGKGESSPYRTILKSATWRNITAVKSKRVFFVPAEPYSWFDIPPSVNRILGLVWFNDIFYGQPNDVTKQKVKEFYHIFYHYDLNDKEYTGLFRWQ
ncbi:MAG: ABC transporter substrate-binding protein [Paludibacter sp.]|nr:ABC transporter substrate-binding protein [Paludibacter sp.]